MVTLKKNEEENIRNYFKVSEYKQGLVIFSDGFYLNKKKIKEIKSFLEYYRNMIDTFICLDKRITTDVIRKFINLDCSERELRIGKNDSNISKILTDNYLPTVIIDCRDTECLEDISNKLQDINEQVQVVILGNKDVIYDKDNLCRQEYASLNSYFAGDNMTDEIIHSMVDWKTDFHPLKEKGQPTIKVFKHNRHV